jgi:hypothetical protein
MVPRTSRRNKAASTEVVMQYHIKHNGSNYVFSTQSQAWFDLSNMMVPQGKWHDLTAAAQAAGVMPKAVKAEKAERSAKVANIKTVNISKASARRRAKMEAITIFNINW